MFRGFNLWKGRNYGRRGLRRKMRGIVCKGEGPPSVMEIGDLEFPVCNQHQCLIKMEATSVNRADILQVFTSIIYYLNSCLYTMNVNIILYIYIYIY